MPENLKASALLGLSLSNTINNFIDFNFGCGLFFFRCVPISIWCLPLKPELRPDNAVVWRILDSGAKARDFVSRAIHGQELSARTPLIGDT